MIRHLRQHRPTAVILATGALFLAFGGAAFGAVSSAPAGVIHSCVSKNGVLRVVGAGKHCQKGEKTLAFNTRPIRSARSCSPPLRRPAASSSTAPWR